ncbi:MAG: lysophospholipid acyltransferase family protein [Porticoccaceae bacterium]
MNAWNRLNYFWRLSATGFCFTMFGLGGVLVPALATPLLYLLPGSAAVRQRRARRLAHWLFLGFAHLMRCLGVLRWRTEGLEKLHRNGLLVLANHPTLIDVVFLVAFIPNANCVVKSRLLINPAMRGFISLAGYITNDSGNSLLNQSARSLENGDVLVIFPEGTRSDEGAPMHFQRGAANIAVRCEVPVTPVIIHCDPPTLSKGHKWYHIPERRFVISFSVGDDIDVIPFLDCPATLGSRRLTRHLEQFFTKERYLHGQCSTV